MSDIGEVERVVATGLSLHPLREFLISNPEPRNPPSTIPIQNSLRSFLDVGM